MKRWLDANEKAIRAERRYQRRQRMPYRMECIRTVAACISASGVIYLILKG